MANPYELVFASLYLWGLRRNGEQDGPQYSAVLGLSLVMLINLASATHILYGLGIHALRIVDLRKEAFLAIGALICAVHYYWFLRNERFRKVARHVKSSDKLRQAGDFLTVLYSLVSISLLLAAWGV